MLVFFSSFVDDWLKCFPWELSLHSGKFSSCHCSSDEWLIRLSLSSLFLDKFISSVLLFIFNFFNKASPRVITLFRNSMYSIFSSLSQINLANAINSFLLLSRMCCFFLSIYSSLHIPSLSKVISLQLYIRLVRK